MPDFLVIIRILEVELTSQVVVNEIKSENESDFGAG